MADASYKAQPFWWDDLRPDAFRSTAGIEDLPGRCDVLIAGAGYSGMTAALTLARAGRSVVVADANRIAFGCSARNGGLIGPSFHKLGLSGLRAAYGAAKARDILRRSMDTLAYLREFIRSEKIDCDLNDGGRFRGAVRREHYDSMAREAEALQGEVGLRFETVSKADQRSECGSDYFHGGIVYPDDGYLQPAKYAAGLAERARQAGVRFFAPAPVSDIRRNGRGFSARVGGRQIDAEQVLVATNGYTGKELPFFRRRIIPARSAIIATEELPGDVAASLSPKGRGLGDSSRLLVYMRMSSDNRRLIFGGRNFKLEDRPDIYVPDLRRLALRIFPQLGNFRVSHGWSGTVGFTFDYAPHIGQHDGVHYVMGFCGSGVGRASYYGRMAALQMAGDPA